MTEAPKTFVNVWKWCESKGQQGGSMALHGWWGRQKAHAPQNPACPVFMPRLHRSYLPTHASD